MIVAAVAALLVPVVTYPMWFPAAGRFLVQADQPQRADIAVVLAGGASGNRVMLGARLVQDGFVERVLLSNTLGCYGLEEAELAMDFAARQGVARHIFVKTAHKSKSTEEEARTIAPLLRKMNVHTFLLITSDYHTRRARRLFRPYLDGLQMRVIAAPDPEFHPDRWWKSREGQKVFFLEWTKTLAATIGF